MTRRLALVRPLLVSASLFAAFGSLLACSEDTGNLFPTTPATGAETTTSTPFDGTDDDTNGGEPGETDGDTSSPGDSDTPDSAGGSGAAAGGAGSGGTAGKVGGSGSGGATTGGSGGSNTGGNAGSAGSSAQPPSPTNIVPTTCEATHGEPGCCGVDNKLYFWNGSTVSSQACPSGTVCAWDSSSNWYNCLTNAATDPSGTYPRQCGGSPVPGACAASPTSDPYADAIKPTTCEEAHGKTGCCGPGNRAYYIGDDGLVKENVCTDGKVCGFREDKGWYGCTDAADVDPSGAYPLLCGGAQVAGACKVSAP